MKQFILSLLLIVGMAFSVTSQAVSFTDWGDGYSDAGNNDVVSVSDLSSTTDVLYYVNDVGLNTDVLLSIDYTSNSKSCNDVLLGLLPYNVYTIGLPSTGNTFGLYKDNYTSIASSYSISPDNMGVWRRTTNK